MAIDTGRIKFIRFEEDLEISQVQNALTSVVGENVKVLRKSELTGLYKVEVAAGVGAEQMLSAGPQMKANQILEVYEDFEVRICLDKAVKQARVKETWERFGLRGKGTTIGIADTGVDVNHPDLRGRIASTEDFVQESAAGDRNGHGTHVTGIAIGDGKKYRGVAPQATACVAKVLDKDGFGRASSVVDGIEWLVEQNVDIISLSLGAPARERKDAIQITCEAAVDFGVIVFCAAGNSGPFEKTINTPGVSPKVITVGAVDDDDSVVDFSSRGPTLAGDMKPDLVAPGNKIISARASGTSPKKPVDDLYAELSGTSMATPFAAGVCLLLKEKFNSQNSDLTPESAKRLLTEQAEFVKPWQQWWNDMGSGRIDALDLFNGNPPKAKPDPNTPESDRPKPPFRFPKIPLPVIIIGVILIAFILWQILK